MGHAGKLSSGSDAPETDLAIISPNDPEAMKAYVAECKDSGIDGCFLLAVNDYELHLIQDKTGLSEDEIVALSRRLIVTLGGNGSRIRVDDLECHIPVALPVEVADPTGAGGAFRAGIMRALQLELNWKTAGRFAALCATYAIEHMGP